MNGTTIEYNGVILNNLLTKEFAQEPIWDESGTDVLGQRFRIAVLLLCHTQGQQILSSGGNRLSADAAGAPFAQRGTAEPNGTGGLVANVTALPVGATATDQELSLRPLLMAKGGKFKMRLGVNTRSEGRVILSAMKPPVDTEFDEDISHGPKPISLKVTSIANDTLIKIEWTVEVCITGCKNPPETSSGVLNNRWSQSDHIDNNWYCTRRWVGKLRLRSAITNPQQFRGLVLPPLADGFRRESMTFGSTADGLTLEYTIVDQEVAFASPFPATHWTLRHSETCGEAIESIGELSISLTGPRTASKIDMIGAAAAILQARFLSVKFNGFKPIIRRLTLTDVSSTDENSVELQASIFHQRAEVKPIAVLNGILALNPTQFSPPVAIPNTAMANYNRDVSADPGIAGTSSIAGATIAALQEVCMDKHAYADVATSPQVVTPPDLDSPPAVSSYIIEDVDDPDYSDLSQEQLDFPYLHWAAESAYSLNANTGPAAIAKATSGSESEAPEPTAKFFRLSRGLATRTVTMEAIRFGKDPQFPNPIDFTESSTGIVHVVLNADVALKAPEKMADGTQIRSATMTITYGLSRPPTISERLGTAPVPWSSNGSSGATKASTDLFGEPLA